MLDKVVNLVKSKDLIVPSLLFYNYKKLGIGSDEVIILIYFINNGEVFNPKEMCNNLNIDLPDLLQSINVLEENDLLELKLVSINNIKEEVCDLSKLYQKLGFLIVNNEQKEEKKKEDTSIFTTFETEFGRTLSPIEYELIKGWIDADFTEEIIILALKEAVFNGVSNLKYIDKILYEWKKKGVKTKKDVQELNRNFRKNSTKKEVFEYDWLNED